MRFVTAALIFVFTVSSTTLSFAQDQSQVEAIEQAAADAERSRLLAEAEQREKQARQALLQDPENATTYFQLSSALRGQGKLSSAAAALTKSLLLEPDHPFSHFSYSWLFYGSWDEMGVTYQQSALLDPGVDTLSLANTAFLQFPAEESAFRDQILEMPESIHAHINLGLLFSMHGRFEEAEPIYRETIALIPEDLYIGDLDSLSDEERYQLHRSRLVPHPIYAEAFHRLADALRYQGKHEEAESAYQESIRMRDLFASRVNVADHNYDYIVTYPHAAAYNALGNSLRAQGKVTEAEVAYQKALTYDPSYRFAHYNLGKLYYQMGRSDDSEQSYRKATYNYDRHIESNVYNPFSYGGLGYALQSQGRWDLALAYYRSALDYRTDDLFAQNNLAETLRLRTLATQSPPTIEEEKRWLVEAEPSSRHRKLPYRSVVRVVTPLALGTSYTVGTVVKREGDRLWILTTRSAITQPIPTGSEDTEYIIDSIEVEFFSDPPVGQVRLRREAEVWRYAELGENLDLAVLVVDDAPPDIQPIAILATPAKYEEERSPEYLILGHQEAPWSSTRSKIDQVISPTTDWLIPGSLVIRNEDIGLRNLGSPMLGRVGSSGDRDQILGLIFQPSDDGGHTYVHPASVIRPKLFQWGLLTLTD